MPKFRFLLFDAGVIIGAFEFGVWSQLIQRCDITITRTVKDQEVYYWTDKQGVEHAIDLNDDVEAGRITCVDVPLAQVENFREKFAPSYLDRMDAGEADSLAYLFFSKEEWLIASTDSHVFKVLGCLHLGERGLSLEEILQKIGLGRVVEDKYSKGFKRKYTLWGEQDGIRDFGLRSDGP